MNIRFIRIFLFLLAALVPKADLFAAAGQPPFDLRTLPLKGAQGVEYIQRGVGHAISAKRNIGSSIRSGYNGITGILNPKILYPLFWGDLDKSFHRLCKHNPNLRIKAEPIFDALKAFLYAEDIPGDRINHLVLLARHLRQGIEDIQTFVHNNGQFATLQSDSLEYCLRTIVGNRFDTLLSSILATIATPLGIDLNTDEGRNALLQACNNHHPISFIFQHLIACDPEFKRTFSVFLQQLDLQAIFNSDEATATNALQSLVRGLEQLVIPNQVAAVSSAANAIIYHPAINGRLSFFQRLGVDAGLNALTTSIGPAWRRILAAIDGLKTIITELIPYAYDPSAREEYPNMVRCFYAARRGETFNTLAEPKTREVIAGPLPQGVDHLDPEIETDIPDGAVYGPRLEDGTFFAPNTEENFIAHHRVDTPLKCFFARLDVLKDHFQWRMTRTAPTPKAHMYVRLYEFIWGGGYAQFQQQIPTMAAGAAENGVVEAILSMFLGDQKDFILDRTIPARPDIHQVPLEADDEYTTLINRMSNGFTPFADGLEDEAHKRNRSAEERAFDKEERRETKAAEKEFNDELDQAVQDVFSDVEKTQHDELNELKRNNQLLFHIPLPNTPFGVGIHVRDVVQSLLGLVNVGLYKKFYTDVRDLRLERLTKKFVADRDRILRLIKDIDTRAREKLARHINPRETSLGDIYRALASGKATRDDLNLPAWLVDKRPTKTWRDKWNDLRGRKRKLDRFDTTPIDNLREYLDDNMSVISVNPLQKDMALIIAKKLALEKGFTWLAEFAAGPTILAPEALYSYERGPGGVLHPVQWTNPETGKTYNKMILSPYGSGKIMNYVSKLVPAGLVGRSVLDPNITNNLGQAVQNFDHDALRQTASRVADNMNAAIDQLAVLDAIPVAQEGREEIRKITAEVTDRQTFVDNYMESKWADSESSGSDVTITSFVKDLIVNFAYGETMRPVLADVTKEVTDEDGNVTTVTTREPVLDENGKPRTTTTPMGYVKKLADTVTESHIAQYATTYWMYIVGAHCYDKIAEKPLKVYLQKNIAELEKLLEAHRSASRIGNPIALEEAEDAIKEFLRGSLTMVNLNAVVESCISTPALMGVNLLWGSIATKLAVMCGSKFVERRDVKSGIAALVCGLVAYKSGKNIYQTIIDKI